MFQPDSNCPQEKAIRVDMARANYANDMRVYWLSLVKLAEHRRICWTCQGISLVDISAGRGMVAK